MKTAALLLAPIVLMAGAAVAAPASHVAHARIGETVRVGGLRITPLRLVEDSRCPQNARCIWAGRVRLSVRIGGAIRELTLGEGTRVPGGTLQLAAVLPDRKTTATRLTPRDYRFAFRFEPRRAELELIRN